MQTPLQFFNSIRRGFAYSLNSSSVSKLEHVPDRTNPLRAFFNARNEGRGIWKWDHYFDVYDRHFRRFRGQEVHVLEIGVYSGGSLDMWRDYFGPRAHIYGVDIQPACKSYEREGIRIIIGNQGDREFWTHVRTKVPTLDIVIDDGSHHPEHQIVTLEELLPHLRPGGVFLCEDVHDTFNPFASYIHGMAHKLNDFAQVKTNTEEMERRLTCQTTSFQAAVGSVHLYPYVAVVERNTTRIDQFIAPKHGTQWQPFLT